MSEALDNISKLVHNTQVQYIQTDTVSHKKSKPACIMLYKIRVVLLCKRYI